MSTTIVWFRNDLRIDDHPALAEASRDAVVCMFVLDDAADGDWAPGAASRWWLHRSLAALDAALRRLGARLVLRRGDTIGHLAEVAQATGAERVVTTARCEPAAVELDARAGRELAARGVRFARFDGALLHDPGEIRTGAGTPYRVFTPFWKSCLERGADSAPLRAPRQLVDAGEAVASAPLDSLELEPRIAWDEGLRSEWTPGSEGAAKRWKVFARGALRSYAVGRDRCAERGSSMLSPHLHFGEISVRRLWHDLARMERTLRGDRRPPRSRLDAARARPRTGSAPDDAAAAIESIRVFRAELGWREFAHHVLAAFPSTTDAPLRPEFARLPWRRDAALLRAWQRGRTGYPLVDAGMRQLWATGWMHNRVRMIAASFLVKHLLQPWQEGARWFWNTLVDADLANNTMGWQWSAGCGADAAPFFRIFNPVSQGASFDAEGRFVRRWVPELAGLAPKWIHRPWQAPASALSHAGIELGGDYPRPIVDHAEGRTRALEAFDSI
ncbi:MAG: deoxyribodipyrimidine photo-lyase [Phycisphaerae bacterium]|nr:deoxyribodipyrimidine photo-lyase [Phycisphaerae bacterium]